MTDGGVQLVFSFSILFPKVSGLLQGIHDFTVSLLGSNHLANIACPVLDCEQSLFFFRFSEGSARERRVAKPQGTRAAAQEEKTETAHTARANEIHIGLTMQIRLADA